jgi:hypothetical protein
VLAALGWAALALVVLIVAGLVLPVRLIVTAAAAPAVLRVQVSLLGGAVPRIVLHDSRAAAPSGARPRRGRRRKREGAGSGARRRLGAVVLAVPRLAADLLHAIRVERARMTVRFGLDDPADTGTLFGALCPVLYTAGRPDGLQLVPDFDGARLDAEGELTLSIIPAALIGPAIRFAATVLPRWPSWR